MKKMLGEERRLQLLTQLKKSKTPITGTDLAKFANVSRQVIVNDMTLLKARNEPIIATSQGYLYMHQEHLQQTVERTLPCLHTSDQTEDELMTIVDCGGTVKNVIVEHPIYGELIASIMVSNRHEVKQFIERVNETQANYLSALTGGIHLHVITAPSVEVLTLIEQALEKKGYLVQDQ
ncbi:transcription repressor NadR [Lysinibacillus irui]|uniref:Transcription repressor NadR n=3 Tax=Lysinibacillus TaxID=400634 RepID=A0AAJ5RIN0_9BACI|nr:MULTISPECIES: transcription repressor NadR [Lysinibacillus]MEA0555100.1 transcription repressor NadR [Lysinibacillus irui]MEA0565584.1 transcription repressor NadR [Lysinibacillus irui]MEA0976815.1 transcription repressor NadR [Lysinibacillus irui]MEA1042969.1 transcription repressor NadR [Lysinibacillus irui]WDV05721.1 transcription repressor NadR [Lysinibacillus irui]